MAVAPLPTTLRCRLASRLLRYWLVMLIGLTVAAPSWAAGVAEIAGADPASRMRVEFDGDRLRMQPLGSDAGGPSYLIAREGKVYAVSQQDGRPMVIDVGAMMQMLGPMLRQMAPPQTFDDVGEFRSIRPLGRQETVAGIVGAVHEVVFVNREGREERKEIVLSGDRRLVEMGRAMMSMGAAFQQALGQAPAAGGEALEQRLRERNEGVLRFGTEYRVLSLSGTTPDSARFRLPAEPMAMPAMGGLPGLAPAPGAAGRGSAPAEPPASGFSLPGLFGGKVERQTGRVEDKVEREVDAATDSAVDKAIERALGRLFGR